MVLRGPRAMSPIPAVPAGKTHTVPGGARIAKEGPVPGYSGFIPQNKNYVIGHGYSDSCRRAAAITDSLRHGALKESIHLSTENKVEGRNFWYSQLGHPGRIDEPKAIKWQASKRETPAELKYCTGKLDMYSIRQSIGTTDKYPTPTVRGMSVSDLPYRPWKLHTRREFEDYKDDTLEVMEGRHHLKGYTGHIHAKQHLFSQSYGKTSRRLNPLPADPYTSASYIDYAENRPLLINEFELKHPMNYHHLQLLKTGEGNLGPLPDGI
ncbi:unnamed protein product [Sphagnum balticum]